MNRDFNCARTVNVAEILYAFIGWDAFGVTRTELRYGSRSRSTYIYRLLLYLVYLLWKRCKYGENSRVDELGSFSDGQVESPPLPSPLYTPPLPWGKAVWYEEEITII